MKFVVSGALVALSLSSVVTAQEAATSDAPPPTVAPPAPVLIKPAPATSPAPPPVMTRPTSPAFPAMTRERELEKWGAAPASSGAWPSVKKESKKKYRAYNKDQQQCLNTTELKRWMAEGMLKACDRLLAGPDAPNAAWSARAQFLQGRALALISQGSTHLALDALDASDAIGDKTGDMLFDLSTGIGNDLLRAFTLNRLGKVDESRALLATVRNARPYATSVVMAADLVEVHSTGSVDTLHKRLDARLPIEPESLRVMFLLNVLQGKVADADPLGDQLDFTAPKMRGGWTMEGAPEEAQQLETEVLFDGLRAYVAHAAGKPEKARAIIEGAKAEVADFVGSDPRNYSKRVSKKRIKSYLARREQGDAIVGKLADAEKMIALRAEAPTMDSEALKGRLDTFENKGTILPMFVEQMRLIEGDTAASAKIAADYFTKLMMRSAMELNEDNLGILLPKNEFVDQYPKFASTGSKWLFSDGSGWSQAKEGDGDVRTVRYETLIGSKAMMEEMLLMAVAKLARDEGRDAFVILSNRSFARRTHTTGWANYVSDSGFEAQARIQLVDAANPPVEFSANPERVITVAQIERDIQPRYDRIMQVKESLKTASR